MFMWMLHELKPLIKRSQKGNVYVNISWIETIECKKLSGNVYVIVTWIQTIE
jgi:hypothetical protein